MTKLNELFGGVIVSCFILVFGLTPVFAAPCASLKKSAFHERCNESVRYPASASVTAKEIKQKSAQTFALQGNGSIDSTWNQGEIHITPAQFSAFDLHLAVPTADGKLLAAGYAVLPGADKQLAKQAAESGNFIVRFTADGRLDSSFDGDGLRFIAPSEAAEYPWIHSLLLQPDGKLLIALGYRDGNSQYKTILVRLNSNGSFDSGFAEAGVKTSLPIAGRSRYSIGGLAQLTNGQLLLAGAAYNAGGNDFVGMIWKLNADGQLATEFGDQGVSLLQIQDEVVAEQIVPLPDGRLLVSGDSYASGNSSENGLLLRLQSDGALDASFGNGSGYRLLPKKDALLRVRPDGHMIALRNEWTELGNQMQVHRYLPDGSDDFGYADAGSMTVVIPEALRFDSMTLATLSLLPDGSAVLGVTGKNDAWDAVPQTGIILLKLTAEGTIDELWGPDAGAASFISNSYRERVLHQLLPQPDGSIWMLGADSEGSYWPGEVNSGPTLLMRLRWSDVDNNGVAEPWQLTPTAFSFNAVENASNGSSVVSNVITIGGLANGVMVPLYVRNGEFSVDGASQWQSGMAWLANGSTLSVRHTAVGTTTVAVGGMVIDQNQGMAFGTVVSANFRSTAPAGEGADAGGSGGGGSVGVLLIALFAIAGSRRKKGTS